MTERVDGAFASSEMAEGPVLVIGAGHVGTFLARELARNLGGRVLLKHRAGSLPRPEVRAICERCGVEVISELDSLAGCRVRAVLLATKTFDHATALHELDRARIRGPRCAVFNGLVPPDALPGVVPCVTFGSWDFVPGTTRMIARNPSVPWRLPPEGRAIAALLGMAGIPAIASDEFRRWQLHKFIVNASANLLSVKRDQHCAGLLAHHRSELMQLLDEIVRVISQDAGDAAVLRAIAPVQPGQSPADALLGVLEDALRSYGSHHPSTWHDHRRGRRLEVDALNGYVLAAAAGAGVRVPHHAALLASLAEAS